MGHNTCSGPGCGSGGYGSQGSCGDSSCKSSSCSGGSCGCGQNNSSGGMHKSPREMTHELFGAAMYAKKDLMKDKLKAHFDKKMGSKLDEVADVMTDAVMEMWKGKQNMMQGKEDVMNKLSDIMKSK